MNTERRAGSTASKPGVGQTGQSSGSGCQRRAVDRGVQLVPPVRPETVGMTDSAARLAVGAMALGGPSCCPRRST